MACFTFPKYSWLDFLFTLFGVCTYLFDVGSDLWVAAEFCQRGHFFWSGLVLSFMLTSSVIVQMFSWFWIKYDRDLENFESETSENNIVLGGPSHAKLTCFLHVCQLGFFFRHVSALRQGFCVWWRRGAGARYAVYLTHDLSMLRLFETFCESAPQLALMVHTMLRTGHARTIQCVSVVASTMSVAWMVVDYHRSLRSYLPEKTRQDWLSSVAYFLWNLLLIAPRVVSVALFTSVLPLYIVAHFLSLWFVFVLWAWLQGTCFMDSRAGEWLYRATIGVIWYFSWFSVSEGRTRWRSLVYHTFILVDNSILLLTWWWMRNPEMTQTYALPLAVLVPLFYVTGLLVKALYYHCCHPTRQGDLPDGLVYKSAVDQTSAVYSQTVNKRMANHVTNFYSAKTTAVTKTSRHERNRIV
ncbi:XK-related protein 8.3 [Electrophorus electricus]|uniref:XK-related protein n=1 Tax=Electrophorus electricus TaxID=8005 RepID=A0A4W4HLP9_ELEEL|nr:XK-related protein 8.3 [Electrophorus electricus]